MFNLFKKKNQIPELNFEDLVVDMHSHILPGIDDGAADVSAAVLLVKRFMNLGFKKLIATPHIMDDYYRNTPEIILKALDQLREELERQNMDIALDAAAEYYLDENFDSKIQHGELLTMGDKHLLFELSYTTEPIILKDTIQKLNDKGYKPILAHPERYPYFYSAIERYHEVREYGCYFQLNTISLTGYYGKQARHVADKLVEAGLVDFIGSDMHHLKHAKALEQSLFLEPTKLLLESGELKNITLK